MSAGRRIGSTLLLAIVVVVLIGMLVVGTWVMAEVLKKGTDHFKDASTSFQKVMENLET